MDASGFARMIVDQEIHDEELNLEIHEQDLEGKQTGRIISIAPSLLERFLMPPTPVMRNDCRHNKKRVQFPEKLKELVTIRHIPRATQEENEMLWYSIAELDRRQEQDDADCLDAMSHDGCRCFLDNVFLETEGRYRRQMNLNCWSRYANNLRGFEVVVNREHSVERYVQKSVNIQSVLLAQAEARDRLTKTNMSATLARVSQRCSRRAREFATALGAADEYAENLQRTALP